MPFIALSRHFCAKKCRDSAGNVVADCSHTIQGWIFFQCFCCTRPAWHEGSGSATAHANTARGNSVCNSGAVDDPTRDPYDIINGVNVSGTTNVSDCSALPAKAMAVIKAAGVRAV